MDAVFHRRLSFPVAAASSIRPSKPAIPPDVRGWGAEGVLDPQKIRSVKGPSV
jgi:hypothetical protein